jgi:hypothetical protein
MVHDARGASSDFAKSFGRIAKQKPRRFVSRLCGGLDGTQHKRCLAPFGHTNQEIIILKSELSQMKFTKLRVVLKYTL